MHTNRSRLLVPAAAAFAGGAMWAAKAGLILLGIADLGWMVVASQGFMGIALLGLYRHSGERGKLARTGAALAAAAVPLSAFNSLWAEGMSIQPYTYMASIAGVLASSVMAGILARRNDALYERTGRWPLWIGTLTFPAVALGSLVHLESGVLLAGFAWMALAVRMCPPRFRAAA
ncbi:hypothetical protein [Paenibacillus sp.]|uniref:hypothetical protein n=1 Tax=Paenibacillus sp. TaxID=58172 RepID=UPI002D4CA048|nr:hypothetical protein [Paenibacillus sp.]HZG86863.1 hypothetical protein [Paenibacillus sp.]